MPIRKRLVLQDDQCIFFRQMAIYLLNTAMKVEIDGQVLVKVANSVDNIKARLDQIYGRKGCWQEEIVKVAFEQLILTVKVWFGPVTEDHLVCISSNGQVCWDEPILEAINKSLRTRRRFGKPVAALIVNSQEQQSAQKRPRLNLLSVINDGKISSRLSSVSNASGQFSKSSLNLNCPSSTTTHLEASMIDFTQLKLVGQFNNEFIVSETILDGKRLLLLIDQHAAHERIRLEELLVSQTSTSLEDLKMQACRGSKGSIVSL